MQTATDPSHTGLQAAKSTAKSEPEHIDSRTFLSKSGYEAASALNQEQAIIALDEMFEDAFLYGFKASEEFGYSHSDRDYILHAYKGFKSIVPVLCRYQWPATGGQLVTMVDYHRIEEFMEGALDATVIIPQLEAMMITSVLYKWTNFGGRPADSNLQNGIYSTFTQLRGLILGYIPLNARQV